MSLENLRKAFQLIERNLEASFLAGNRDIELIEKAENALGLKFPPSYRQFVERYGCGNVAGFEIYGVSSDNFENSSVPNGIWLTLDERKHGSIPNDLVVIGDTGNGGWYALKTSESTAGGECPVIEKYPGVDDMPTVAPDFGTFLLEELKSAINGE